METEACIETQWKAFALLNPNYSTTLFYFEGNAELGAVGCSHCAAAPKCLLAVLPHGTLVPAVKPWELSLDKEKGVKPENLVKYFFLLNLGQELSTQGCHRGGSHSSTCTLESCHASGLPTFLKLSLSCRGEPPLWEKLTLLPHRSGVLASYNMGKLVSGECKSDLFTVCKQWSSSLPGPRLRQDLVTGSHETGRRKAGVPLFPSSVGADPGP